MTSAECAGLMESSEGPSLAISLGQITGAVVPPQHLHDGYELMTVERGEGVLHIGSRPHVLRPGMLGVVRAGTVHTASLVGSHIGLRSGGVSGSVLRSLFIASVDPKPEPPGSEAIDGFTLNDPDMYDAFVAVHDACDRDTPPDDASCRMAELLLELATRYPSPVAAAAAGENGQRRGVHEGITRAREYVRAHLGERLTLDVLAGIACLSPFHFTRTFRDAVGLTPHAYVLHTRLARAQTLLAAQLPVSEVAYGTGFADQSHLTHAFRRQFGCTPARYARGARQILLEGFPLAA